MAEEKQKLEIMKLRAELAKLTSGLVNQNENGMPKYQIPHKLLQQLQGQKPQHITSETKMIRQTARLMELHIVE